MDVWGEGTSIRKEIGVFPQESPLGSLESRKVSGSPSVRMSYVFSCQGAWVKKWYFWEGRCQNMA